MLPEEDRAIVMGNMPKNLVKIGRDMTKDMTADRQTHKQTDTDTHIIIHRFRIGGGVKK